MCGARRILFLAIAVWLASIAAPAFAQITPEQRRELGSINKEVSDVGKLIRKKEFAEAEAILQESQRRLEAVSAALNVPLTDRAFRPFITNLTRQQSALDRARAAAGPEISPVQFSREVAPLVAARCLSCHEGNKSGGSLRLTTIESWKSGGKSGPLYSSGDAKDSLLVKRLHAPQGKGGMPAKGEPLLDTEIALISRWIDEGASFGDAGEQTPLRELASAAQGMQETSFVQDIAPWFVNLCLGCHNDGRKSGGLSMTTFQSLQTGGDSGEVILPGDLENSRLYRLVGGLEAPRMPRGQARITRKNLEDLQSWIQQGAKYDGADPREPLSSLVPTDADRFNAMSEEEFQAYRSQRSADQMKRALPNDSQQTAISDAFLVLGNGSQERLEEVRNWADDILKTLQKGAKKESAPWRGRLAIFVFNDRFGYDEFNEVIEQRRPTSEMTGHYKVAEGQADAYVAIWDRTDFDDDQALKASLTSQLAAAYVERNGRRLPVWLVQGIATTIKETVVKDRRSALEAQRTGMAAASSIGDPERVFDDTSYSPSTIGPAGYALVQYLTVRGGAPRFAKFVEMLQGGTPLEESMQAAYGAPCSTVATGFLASLKNR